MPTIAPLARNRQPHAGARCLPPACRRGAVDSGEYGPAVRGVSETTKGQGIMSMLEKMARRLAQDALERVQPGIYTSVVDGISLYQMLDGNYQVGERLGAGDEDAPGISYETARETMVAMMAAEAGALVVVPEDTPMDSHLAQIAQLLVNSAEVPTDAQDVADGACTHSWNPWWGCLKVSPGCEHCYAETFAKRTGHAIWGPAATTQRRTFGDKHWQEPLKWNEDAIKAGERRRVFCASMADVFEAHPQLHTERALLWALIEQTPALDWLLLTKRPENIADMVPSWWATDGYPNNVWIGTSVENQAAADKRIPILATIPAEVRYLSCEPLLGPVDLAPWMGESEWTQVAPGVRTRQGPLVDWVICGGESGPKARPMHPDWARGLYQQCSNAGVAFFMKQLGGTKDKRDKLSDFPMDLQVRESPSGA